MRTCVEPVRLLLGSSPLKWYQLSHPYLRPATLERKSLCDKCVNRLKPLAETSGGVKSKPRAVSRREASTSCTWLMPVLWFTYSRMERELGLFQCGNLWRRQTRSLYWTLIICPAIDYHTEITDCLWLNSLVWSFIPGPLQITPRQ